MPMPKMREVLRQRVKEKLRFQMVHAGVQDGIAMQRAPEADGA